MTDLPLSPLLHRADAITGGLSDGELARMVRRGELSRLQRGTYRQGTEPMTDTARHAAVVAATVTGLRVPGMVSHVSAAVLHGLRCVRDRPLRLRLVGGSHGGRVRRAHQVRPPAAPRAVPGDVVYEEKLREDDIRDIGWQVARWTWSDLDRPRVVGDRLVRAFARAQAHPLAVFHALLRSCITARARRPPRERLRGGGPPASR